VTAPSARGRAAGPRLLRARGQVLDLAARPLIVGVLNATPDSFYDRGRYYDRDRAMARADELVAEGADLVEVGGETARPGPAVDVAEEQRRVVPLIGALAARLPVPLTVDTYKPEVARAAVDAGAVLINDISGLADPAMAKVAAATGAALVVMHIQGRPKVRQVAPRYEAVVDEVYAFLEERTARAQALGVPADRLVVDPGFSFGKTPYHDVEILRRLREFSRLGYPIYLATSRKNYIRDILGLPVDDLLEGTLAAVAYGAARMESRARHRARPELRREIGPAGAAKPRRRAGRAAGERSTADEAHGACEGATQRTGTERSAAGGVRSARRHHRRRRVRHQSSRDRRRRAYDHRGDRRRSEPRRARRHAAPDRGDVRGAVLRPSCEPDRSADGRFRRRPA
jgi:dihydropteroate synthase